MLFGPPPRCNATRCHAIVKRAEPDEPGSALVVYDTRCGVAAVTEPTQILRCSLRIRRPDELKEHAPPELGRLLGPTVSGFR